MTWSDASSKAAPTTTERRSGSSRLTAYDTQTTKEQYAEAHGSESNSKLAVWSPCRFT